MLHYNLAIAFIVNQKPVTFQDTAMSLYTLLYTLFGEK